MPTIPLDKKTRVTWVPLASGIVDINAPTVAELTAGTDLQDFMTPDGLNFPAATGSIDNSNLGSDMTTNRVGRRSISSASLKMQRQSQANDTVADMLAYLMEGFVVIRRGLDKAAAWAASQEVKVYPAQCGEASEPQSGPEQNWTYEVPVAVTDTWATKGIVAA